LYEGRGVGFAVFDGFAVNVGLAEGAADDGDDVVAVAVTAVRGAAVSAVVSPANCSTRARALPSDRDRETTSTNVTTARARLWWGLCGMFLPAAAAGGRTTVPLRCFLPVFFPVQLEPTRYSTNE